MHWGKRGGLLAELVQVYQAPSMCTVSVSERARGQVNLQRKQGRDPRRG